MEELNFLGRVLLMRPVQFASLRALPTNQRVCVFGVLPEIVPICRSELERPAFLCRLLLNERLLTRRSSLLEPFDSGVPNFGLLQLLVLYCFRLKHVCGVSTRLGRVFHVLIDGINVAEVIETLGRLRGTSDRVRIRKLT